MIVTFTGTRKGMTKRQHSKMLELLAEFQPTHVRHGAAIGADEQFHSTCVYNDVPLIEVFPSNIKSQSMSTIIEPPTGTLRIHPAQDPLTRNYLMVKGADLVIACPDTSVETIRSGTWATVRYADRLGRKIVVIKPQEDAVDQQGALRE